MLHKGGVSCCHNIRRGHKGEFVGSIESEFLIDSICIEACRSYFPGFFQFMSFGVFLIWIQLPSFGLLTAIRGVGAELAGIDIYVYGLGKTSFTGITGIAGNIDSIFTSSVMMLITPPIAFVP